MEDTEGFDKMTTEAYNAMTSHGDIPLTCHIYKLSFLNFLFGKQPNGPGQFMFGLVGSYNMKKFSIDIESSISNMNDIKCAHAKMEKQLLNLDRPVVFFVVL